MNANKTTGFTVWVQQADGKGTPHVSFHDTENLSEAEKLALEETAADWGKEGTDDLEILGVVKGQVTLEYWKE